MTAAIERSQAAEAAEVAAAALREMGEEPRDPVQDVQRLLTHLRGYKGAYETLNAEKGQILTERDGYKTANETLNAELGELRGYEAAYEALSAEVGGLKSELEGYRGAGRTLAEALRKLGEEPRDLVHDTRRVLAHLDGYKAGYASVAAEVGQLRALAIKPLRTDEEVARHGGRPSIFVATLPKSGTVYIHSTLAQTLGYDQFRPVVSTEFPKNVVRPIAAHDFTRGGMVSVSHLQADAENIRSLRKAGITRGILQIRDPRSALLSWMGFYAARRLYMRLDPELSGVYDQWSPDEQFEWHWSNFFRQCIEWLSTWDEALSSNQDLDFLVLTYEELARDEVGYFSKLLAHYGLKAELKTPPLDQSTHFYGTGHANWRERFSPGQIARLNAMIPDHLWRRFGWQP